MAKLFIVGFPKDMEEVELVEMFSIYGIVNTVTIITDKDSGESKGYGFITMLDQAGADRAIAAMDGAEIDDRKISVRIAENKNMVKTEPAKNSFRNSFTQSPASTRDPQQGAPKKKRPRRS